MTDLVTCPKCDGKGYRWSTPPGFNPFEAGGWTTARAMQKHPCRRCGETGQITADHARRISEGRAMRDARVARMQSQRERAEELGISPEKLNDMEQGKAPASRAGTQCRIRDDG